MTRLSLLLTVSLGILTLSLFRFSLDSRPPFLRRRNHHRKQQREIRQGTTFSSCWSMHHVSMLRFSRPVACWRSGRYHWPIGQQPSHGVTSPAPRRGSRNRPRSRDNVHSYHQLLYHDDSLLLRIAQRFIIRLVTFINITNTVRHPSTRLSAYHQPPDSPCAHPFDRRIPLRVPQTSLSPSSSLVQQTSGRLSVSSHIQTPLSLRVAFA